MAVSKSERKTENVVRDALRELGYYRASNKITVEEQRSQIDAIRRLMRAASKSGQGGAGSPEFIISSPANPDFLLIIECKADPRDHISETCQAALNDGAPEEEDDDQRVTRIKRFAVDGALHYAKSLAREFNVIVVAVSGESADNAVMAGSYR